MEKLLLRVAEAAELAAVSRSHAYALVKAGVWPSIMVGSSIRVPLGALRRWIEEQTEPGWIAPEPVIDADEGGGLRLTRR